MAGGFKNSRIKSNNKTNLSSLLLVVARILISFKTLISQQLNYLVVESCWAPHYSTVFLPNCIFEMEVFFWVRYTHKMLFLFSISQVMKWELSTQTFERPPGSSAKGRKESTYLHLLKAESLHAEMISCSSVPSGIFPALSLWGWERRRGDKANTAVHSCSCGGSDCWFCPDGSPAGVREDLYTLVAHLLMCYALNSWRYYEELLKQGWRTLKIKDY